MIASEAAKSSSNAFLDELRRQAAAVESAVERGPIVPKVAPEEIRAFLTAQYDFRGSRELEAVVADVERMLHTWQVQVTHPRYFGLYNPSVTFASVVGDTLAAIYNPQLASWRTSPAANEIERHVLGWLTKKLGFPETTACTFTTGGSEANLTAVIAALTRHFPGFGDHGLRSLPGAPVLYVSSEAHHSFLKVAHMTGLGRNALRLVAAGPGLKMDLDDLARKVAEDRSRGLLPFFVAGTAGTTAAGVIDPLSGIADFCAENGLWFHADAAWGGAAVLSASLKDHLKGIERADSVTCDAHKWLSVPMGAGMFFCRHADAVGEAFRAATPYMPCATGAMSDPYTTTVQWSRRFIGLKLFMALANQGEDGYATMIEHQAKMGDLMRESLRETGWRIVNETPLPVICFTRDDLDCTRFLSRLFERQIAWMAEVRLNGAPPVIRACVTSYRTTEADIRDVVAEMNALL